MELYSVIKNNAPGDLLVSKFEGEDFNNASQLIVTESEEALFMKDGVIVQSFSGGRFTLDTKNYPFISALRKARSTVGSISSIKYTNSNSFGAPIRLFRCATPNSALWWACARAAAIPFR